MRTKPTRSTSDNGHVPRVVLTALQRLDWHQVVCGVEISRDDEVGIRWGTRHDVETDEHPREGEPQVAVFWSSHGWEARWSLALFGCIFSVRVRLPADAPFARVKRKLERAVDLLEDKLSRAAIARVAVPLAGVCSRCGCEDQLACVDERTGDSCAWVDRSHTLCSACETADERREREKPPRRRGVERVRRLRRGLGRARPRQRR